MTRCCVSALRSLSMVMAAVALFFAFLADIFMAVMMGVLAGLFFALHRMYAADADKTE